MENTKEYKRMLSKLKNSESTLKAITTSAKDAIFILNEKGEVTYWNNSAESVYGFTRKEVIGNKFFKFIVPKNLQKDYKQFFDNYKTTGVTSFSGKTGDYIAVRKNGEEFFSEVSITDLTLNGKLHFLIIARDVTERKKTQETLKESDEILHAITDSAHDAIYIMDELGKIIYFNDAAVKMYGYSKDEIMGEKVYHLSPERFNGAHRESLKKFQKTGHTEISGVIAEYIGLRKNGEEFPVEVSASTVNLKGKSHIVAIIRDISDRKISENLKVEKDAATAANKAKSDFLASISHEIRTPMNVIIGFSELLEGQIENREHKEYLSAISSSGKTLLSLISDILDISKIESGKLELHNETTNVHQIFKEMKQIFKFKANEKGLDFNMNIERSIPETLLLDDRRLRQILMNLLSNAVKFTDVGFVTLVAAKHFKSSHSKLDLQISIQDSGIGIPRDQHEIIFEEFKQQNGQNEEKYTGTGLGLSITKKLLTAMNGDVLIDSAPGAGSTFHVIIKDVVVPPVAITSNDASLIQEIENFRFNDMTVLIVDDVENNRALFRVYMEREGIKTLEAKNGEEAISMAREHKPNIILMDLKMPVMDGFEATYRLKNDKKLCTIPVLAVTASAMQETVDRIKAAGCNGILMKPISKTKLLCELKRFI